MDRSPEEKLLLYVARTSMSKEATREIRAIACGKPDWVHFVRRARQEGIAPLAYWNFRKIGVKNVIPDAIMHKLRQDYCSTFCLNMIRFKELGDLLRVLKDDGIEVILLKGAALAEIAYPGVGLRPMEDFDLLVRRENMPRFAQRLHQSGYRFIPFAEGYSEAFSIRFKARVLY